MAKKDYSIFVGASKEFKGSLFDKDGNAVDLTDQDSMIIAIEPVEYLGTVTAEFALSLDGLATLGKVKRTFVEADTLTLNPGDYRAQIHVHYIDNRNYFSKIFPFYILGTVEP